MPDIITDDTRVRLRPDLDLTRLSLSAQEGFLLSRIQGEIRVRELYLLSMADRNTTATMIKKLVDDGVLETRSQQSGAASSPLEALLPERNFDGFIFNLIELQEEADLPQSIKKEILFVHTRLDGLTHYELLGLPSSADDAQIKKAFLNLSKLYHPDSYFRKELGGYREKINTIYSHLSEAYKTLVDPALRREYRRGLIERNQIESAPEDVEEDPHERKRRLEMEAKLRRLKRNPMKEKILKAREFFEAGQRDVERQAWISAANNFKMATIYDPHNELYQHKAGEVKELANRAAAERVYQRALVLESYGQDGYFEGFIKAAKTYPQGGTYNIKVAKLYCDQMDWHDALPYAQRAVAADPGNMENRLTLAKILLRLKDKEEAVKHLTTILKREPDNEQAKAMLKDAKRWF